MSCTVQTKRAMIVTPVWSALRSTNLWAWGPVQPSPSLGELVPQSPSLSDPSELVPQSPSLSDLTKVWRPRHPYLAHLPCIALLCTAPALIHGSNNASSPPVFHFITLWIAYTQIFVTFTVFYESSRIVRFPACHHLPILPPCYHTQAQTHGSLPNSYACIKPKTLRVKVSYRKPNSRVLVWSFVD